MINQQLSTFLNKKILILGLGLEGQASLRFFIRNYPDVYLGVADRKTQAELEPTTQQLTQSSPVKIHHHGDEYLKCLESYDLIVKSPGISPRLPEIEAARKSGVQILSATNIFFQLFPGTIVGVSGTKGKSTTAALIHAIFEEAQLNSHLLGNIGKPALDALTYLQPEDICVFELSSYQLEDLKGELAIGVILNLFPEHLDYHQRLEEYYSAKLNLARCVKKEGAFVYNAACDLLCKTAAGLQCHKLPFNDECTRVESNTLYLNNETLLLTDAISLQGHHNWLNVLAACQATRKLNISNDILTRAIVKFKPLPHRLQNIGKFSGIYFIDDALSTTPQSTIAAINASDISIGSIILGGFDRGYDFSELVKVVIDAKIQSVILFPTSGDRIWAEFEELKARQPDIELPRHFFVGDMKSCIELAHRHTAPETACLLSTASPSYGIFKDYQDKARQFGKWARAISRA